MTAGDHTPSSGEWRCTAVDAQYGRCVLDADHKPGDIHAWEKVPGPPGPPQKWHTPGSGERLTEAERTTVEEALRMWEAKGPTSLTVALLADALYGVRDGLRAADATWALREPSLWESPDARSVPTLLAAIGQVLARHAAEPGAQEAG